MKIFFALIFSVCSAQLFAQKGTNDFSAVKENQKINGFTAKAIYLNDAGEPMGGRFIHDRTGFTLDLLRIESVPQTFIWVNSFPVSEKGEPHTQEHLLITKGNKGRLVNTRGGMSLSQSNAFTSQLYTAYHFDSGAGTDVFNTVFEGYMDALLHPDYTDEEVHREVMNWGVAEDAATKKLRIEEKGSVYNEMKTSMNNSFRRVNEVTGDLLYGVDHPLSYNAGGSTDGIRVLNAADIKKFHDMNYHLWNMGAVTALPADQSLQAALASNNAILNRLQPANERVSVPEKLSPIRASVDKSVKIVDYPSQNEKEPGLMLFSYPATLDLTNKENLLLNNFLATIANDAGTNLYKIFIDTKTQSHNLDAQGVFAFFQPTAGHPVIFGLQDVSLANVTPEKAAEVKDAIKAELNRIALFPDNSPELKEFNDRFKNNLTDTKRTLAKFTNTPPKFGGRNTGDDWYSQLLDMNKEPGFRKSVVLKEEFAAADALLASGKNFWKTYLTKWNLLSAEPYTVIGKANSKMLQQQDSAAKARAADEVARLKVKYNVTDEQEAIQKYREEYAANSAVLDKAAQSVQIKFTEHPPLTLDDQLNFKTTTVAGTVPLTSSYFNNMSSASTGIAFKLNKVPENRLVYLAMLPELLTGSGIIKNGKAVSYEEMAQLLRQQILSLNCYYSTNFKTKRAEVIVKGSGNNISESKTAVDWISDVSLHPNWTKENLPRMRDLVNQSLSGKRKRMQSREEAWVNDPAYAYRAQDQPLILATASFLTTTHNTQRLRWMLMDAGTDAERNDAIAFLQKLSPVTGTRTELKNLFSKMQKAEDTSTISASMQSMLTAFQQLTGKSKQVVIEVAKDLVQNMNEIPDESLSSDIKYLIGEMGRDLSQGPAETLVQLENVRKMIFNKNNARAFVVSSSTSNDALKPKLESYLGSLPANQQSAVNYSSEKVINRRYNLRSETSDKIVFAGLINPNSATGVFINSANIVTYTDTSRDQLLDYLAAQLFAGGGKQSVYTKSTGAGLSYSTGVSAGPANGHMQYYAERTPLLPQTLSFIIDEIKKTPNDPALSEYVLSMSMRAIRSGLEYETRGEAMAQDIADGVGSDKVAGFRKAILKLRADPNLMTEVYSRKDKVYERILPGYGAPMSGVAGGNYFVIGPEKQMAAYESYLKSKEGEQTKLVRIYPRDFWLVN